MHILQRMAEKTKRNSEADLLLADYDFADGLRRQGDRILAFDTANKPVSKKNDVETGEDQKGQ